MTNADFKPFFTLSGQDRFSTRGVQRLRTRHGGRLSVVRGRIWLTRQHDLDDHVLAEGQSLQLGAHDQVVVQPWVDGHAARLAWQGDQPRRLRAAEAPLRVAGAARAAALRGLERVLAAAGARLLAWARSAAASANRAQGAICCGASSASSGALQ